MSTDAVQGQIQFGHADHEPPLTNWLVALSHDSPLKRPPEDGDSAGTSPPLAAVPGLLSLLQDADPKVRLQTASAAGNLAREIRRVLPALRTALEDAARRDEDGEVRAAAVQALLRAGPQPATEVAALVDALRTAIDVVRFHAAMALGDWGPVARPAVPALIHASSWDEEPAVRVAAAMALRKIDDLRGPMVVNVLAKALADVNELVCWVAAECLAQMGPEARNAIPALLHALKRGYRLRVVPASIRLALERIGGQPADATE